MFLFCLGIIFVAVLCAAFFAVYQSIDGDDGEIGNENNGKNFQ